MVNNVILNCLKLLKAGILKTLYLTPLDFLTAYKFRLVTNKKLIKKQKLVYYLSQGYKLLVLALTIKTKEEESALEPVTLAPLLLPFKEVKGLNTKILRSLFLLEARYLRRKEQTLNLINLRLQRITFLQAPCRNVRLKRLLRDP